MDSPSRPWAIRSPKIDDFMCSASVEHVVSSAEAGEITISASVTGTAG
jgi:hypothetical protein